MGQVLKALVISGRYKDEKVRVTNISLDARGRQFAACIFSDARRANLPVEELQFIEEEREPENQRARTAMPFVSGSTGSRSINQTKSLVRKRASSAPAPSSSNRRVMVVCESCGEQFNQEDRKGRPGKITQCEDCAMETVELMEGTMVFSHKTGATIEIKQDGELKHEAEIFDPKNKN